MELALEKVEEDNGRSCRSPLVSELTTRQQYVPTSYKITQNAVSNRTEQFDDIVIDHFYTAIRAGLVDRKLPICDGAPTPSTMAMVRRLLCSPVERSRRQGGAARSGYPLVDTINAGVDGVVEFFLAEERSRHRGAPNDVSKRHDVHVCRPIRNSFYRSCSGIGRGWKDY